LCSSTETDGLPGYREHEMMKAALEGPYAALPLRTLPSRTIQEVLLGYAQTTRLK